MQLSLLKNVLVTRLHVCILFQTLTQVDNDSLNPRTQKFPDTHSTGTNSTNKPHRWLTAIPKQGCLRTGAGRKARLGPLKAWRAMQV